MKPLEGITVLDLTRLLPGAVATMMLGDYGADIIKIEEPGTGDPMRHSRAGVNQPDAFFQVTNRNKRSVTINLKHAAGRDIFLKLVEKADIVVEGFRPGVMDRLGIGYDTLKAINPRLIFCSISGYGQDGPYRDKAGHDINYTSTAGLLGINGTRGGAPAIPAFQIADLAAGSLHAVAGILLALQARARSGEGQMVDISMTDCSLSLMYLPLATYLANGAQPQRGAGGLSGQYACYQIYETKDGRYLSLGALEPKFWEGACRVLGCEELIPLQFSNGRQAEVIEALQTLFRARTAEEWLSEFEGVDTCITLVKDIPEMMADPQIQHRGLIAEIETASGDIVKQIAPLIKLSATPGAMQSPPPRLGEHNREVLTSLGYDDEAIHTFRSAGVT